MTINKTLIVICHSLLVISCQSDFYTKNSFDYKIKYEAISGETKIYAFNNREIVDSLYFENIKYVDTSLLFKTGKLLLMKKIGGGTGVRIYGSIIIDCNNGDLNIAAYLIDDYSSISPDSYYDEENKMPPPFEKESYKAEIKYNDRFLILNQKHEKISEMVIKDNFSLERRDTILFDKVLRIYTNAIREVPTPELFYIASAKVEKDTIISTPFHILKTLNDEYYYINKVWYLKNQNYTSHSNALSQLD